MSVPEGSDGHEAARDLDADTSGMTGEEHEAVAAEAASETEAPPFGLPVYEPTPIRYTLVEGGSEAVDAPTVEAELTAGGDEAAEPDDTLRAATPWVAATSGDEHRNGQPQEWSAATTPPLFDRDGLYTEEPFAEPMAEPAGLYLPSDVAPEPLVEPPELYVPADVAPEPVVEPAGLYLPSDVAPEPVVEDVVPEPLVEPPELYVPADVAPEPVVEPAELYLPADVAPEPVVEPAELYLPSDVAPEPVVEPAELYLPSDVAPEPVVEPEVALPVDPVLVEPDPAGVASQDDLVYEPLAWGEPASLDEGVTPLLPETRSVPALVHGGVDTGRQLEGLVETERAPGPAALAPDAPGSLPVDDVVPARRGRLDVPSGALRLRSTLGLVVVVIVAAVTVATIVAVGLGVIAFALRGAVSA